jgi:hypothetical protein
MASTIETDKAKKNSKISTALILLTLHTLDKLATHNLNHYKVGFQLKIKPKNNQIFKKHKEHQL